ncbi:MAG TPA: phage tail protein [Cytophagales bacterium]|nr:phage tail protein [Cytophagales bacterium]HAA19022.1 phage tail protein [Cytophagales bacterium]HAP63199.1 phage tail protein [Cytophagales bacterium]
MEGTISNITNWAPNWSPRNWFPCDGRLLSIAQFTAFFSLIGTIYGGDGRTSFAVPDLRGRSAVGYGTGPGRTPRIAGQAGGTEWVTLNILEMPIHNHAAAVSSSGTGTADLYFSSATGGSDAPVADGSIGAEAGASAFVYNTDSSPSVKMAQASIQNVTANVSVTIGLSGGSQSHENMSPWLAVGYIICYQGIFPSRN